MKVKKQYVHAAGFVVAFLVLVFAGNQLWLDFVVSTVGQVSSFSLLATAGFALLGGLVTFFTPCGLAVLPAFLSYNLATVGEADDAVLGYLFKLGVFASLGMMTFFAVLGAVFFSVGSAVNAYLTPVKYGIAVLLVIFGWMLFNGTTVVSRWFDDVRGSVHERAMQNEGVKAYYIFGFAYGLDAIGCLFPLVFAVMITPIISGDFVTGLTAAVTYSIGIAIMLVVFTYGVARGQEAITRVKDYAVVIRKVAGVGLVIGGIILLLYYWLYGMAI